MVKLDIEAESIEAEIRELKLKQKKIERQGAKVVSLSEFAHS